MSLKCHSGRVGTTSGKIEANLLGNDFLQHINRGFCLYQVDGFLDLAGSALQISFNLVQTREEYPAIDHTCFVATQCAQLEGA